MTQIKYETKTNWQIKSLAITYAGFWLLMCLVAPEGIAEVWQEAIIIIKLLLFMTIATAPLLLLETFVKKIVFTSQYIEMRSSFLFKIKYEYTSINTVYFDLYSITINFVNNKKIKIHYYEGNLDKIMSVIKDYCSNGKLVKTSLGGVYIIQHDKS